jgi:ATP-binding cassette subfamily C protein CydCD
VLAGRAAVAWAQESAAHRASAEVKSRLRLALLRRAVGMGPRWSAATRSGEVVALATRGIDALDGYFARYLPQLVLASVLPAVIVLTILASDAISALTILATVPLVVLFMVLVGMASERRRRRRWNALARLAHHFLDVVAGLPTLKVFGRSRVQVGLLESTTDAYRRETLAALRVAFLSAFVLELFATLSVALIAVGIGLRLVAGEMDLRTGLFVLVLAPEAYLPLRQLGAQFHAAEEGMGAAEQAFAIIEAPRPPSVGRAGVPDIRAGGLFVEDVTVRQPERGLLAPYRASLAVAAGEVVALAGPSGAGKTTLLAVIAGLLSPDEGRVWLVGGNDRVALDEVDPVAWRTAVAWVAQDPYLFAGTLADNVRLGAPDASDAAVRDALAAVGLADIDPATALGERGSGLSSGQRRRVAIARAFVRDAPLVLLDEPTAGLDEESERLVLAAVRHLARTERRAVILVGHRPAALAMADRAVRLDWRADAGAPGDPHAGPSSPAGASGPAAGPVPVDAVA